MVRAYVLIDMMAGYARALVDSLCNKKGIVVVNRVTGPYDIIVIIEGEDMNSISEFVSNEIHTMSGVVRTTTCVTLGQASK